MECKHCNKKKKCTARRAGETGMFLQDRIKGHMRSVRKKDKKHSAWTQHYITHHPEKMHDPQFHVTITDRPTTQARRKIREAMRIAELPEDEVNLNVNRHDEQGKVQSVLLNGLTAATRDKFRWKKKKAAIDRV